MNRLTRHFNCCIMSLQVYTMQNILYRMFGWAICSERSPEAEKVILGATLEIQRLQREEILEQQILRQQVKVDLFNLDKRYKYYITSNVVENVLIFF